MAKQPSTDNNLADEAFERIWSHYKDRPFRAHLAAWLLIGVALGITMLPGFDFGALMGFGISGVLFGVILSLLTYPFSGHFSFTVAGAFVGAAILPVLSIAGFYDEIISQYASLCLLVGAIIGSTSSIWQVPMTIVRTFKNAFAENTLSQVG